MSGSILSQKLVFEILRKLGGTATPKQIADLAKKMYPERTLYKYVSNRLVALSKWGYVKRNKDGTWTIHQNYP